MKLQVQVKWQVKMKLQVQVQVKMKVKVKVKYKLVKLSGSPRKNERRRVGAEESGSTSRAIEQEKSITGGCAPNGCVRLAEWESCK